MPRRWMQRVKHGCASLGPVTASRMVRDYVTDLYEPAAEQASRITADGYAPARELAAWKRRVLDGWDAVHVADVSVPTPARPSWAPTGR